MATEKHYISTSMLLTRYLLFFIITLCQQANAQYTPFKISSEADSAWINRLAQHLNSGKKETDYDKPRWEGGIVLYSPDRMLRIAQVNGYTNSSEVIRTTFQFICNDTVIEQELSDEYHVGYSPIVHVYSLPAQQYLLLAHEGDTKSLDDIVDIATVISLSGNELITTDFYPREDPVEGETDKELQLKSGVVYGIDHPKPFLKFDSARNELSYLGVTTGEHTGSRPPYVVVYTGTYRLEKGVFVQAADTSWYAPGLDSLTKIISKRTHTRGSYCINTVVTDEYNDINGGVFKLRKHYHTIGRHKFACRFMEAFDLEERSPAAKLLPGGGLVFKTTDDHNYYAPGVCGSCEYFDHQFYYIKGNSSQLLLTISDNTGYGHIDYSFIDNNGNAVEAQFVLDDAATFLDADIIWNSPGKIVVKVSGNSDNLTRYRDYTFFLTPVKNKCLVRMTKGAIKVK